MFWKCSCVAIVVAQETQFLCTSGDDGCLECHAALLAGMPYLSWEMIAENYLILEGFQGICQHIVLTVRGEAASTVTGHEKVIDQQHTVDKVYAMFDGHTRASFLAANNSISP